MLPNVSESWDIGLLGMFIQGPHSPFQTFIHKPKKKHLKGKNEGAGGKAYGIRPVLPLTRSCRALR